jgi:ribosomal protein S18 acetylase RimI-like enzyme
MSITVRKLTPDDAEEYRRCRLDALQDSPSAFATSFEEESARDVQFFRDRFERQQATDTAMFAAFDGERIVGLTGILCEDRERRKHKMSIVSVFVRPEYRGRGIARDLMQRAIDHAKSVGIVTHLELGVESENMPAIKLYEAFGFRTWGVEPDFQIVDGEPHNEAYMGLRL